MSRCPAPHPPTVALAAFVAGQAALLAAAAWGWHWSHDWPATPGAVALPAVAVGQVVLSSLLAAPLCPTGRAALVAAAVAVPFQLATVALQPAPLPLIPPSVLWIGLWIAALHLLVRLVGRHATPPLAAWIALDAVALHVGRPLWPSPLTSVASTASTSPHRLPGLPLCATITLLALLGAAALARRVQRRNIGRLAAPARQSIHTE